MVRRAEAESNARRASTGRTTEDGSHAVDAETRAANEHHGRRRPQYSGEGEIVKNAILFGGGMVTIVVSLWLFSTYPENWWLFFLGILAYGLALMVPTLFLNGATAKHSTGGTEVTLDLPRNASEMAQRAVGTGEQKQDRVV
ncbi:hypothetical protein IUU84_08535 [Kocuria rhizophila]|uniref:hypothetical protein n=1 Tax=Kocuria rhizophila TaxID=72000 RepID=UPI0029496325|nr:hypothetical protein [Kocuria rhizophila]MDV5999617.1 hypothetical protein [Kocuria rhizophila]